MLGAVKLAITLLGRLLLKTKQRYETKQRPSAFREEMKKWTKIIVSGRWEKLVLLNIKQEVWETDKDKKYKEKVMAESIKEKISFQYIIGKKGFLMSCHLFS